MNRQAIEKRVALVGEATLCKQKYVCCIDILLGIGYLDAKSLSDWRFKRISYLEQSMHCSLGKISWAMKCFRSWARKKSLKPSETIYKSHGSGAKISLRFSKSFDQNIELAYRTHYVLPKNPPTSQQ